MEVDSNGKIVKDLSILPLGTINGKKSFMRNARKLENGHYLVAHYGGKRVVEYDENGNYVGARPRTALDEAIENWNGGYDEEGDYTGEGEYDADGNYVGPKPTQESLDAQENESDGTSADEESSGEESQSENESDYNGDDSGDYDEDNEDYSGDYDSGYNDSYDSEY